MFYTFARVTVVQLRTEAAAPAADDEGAPGTTAKYLVCNFAAWVTVHGAACQLADMLTQKLRFGSVVTPKPPQATQLGMNFCSWGYFLLLGLLVLSLLLGLLVGEYLQLRTAASSWLNTPQPPPET